MFDSRPQLRKVLICFFASLLLIGCRDVKDLEFQGIRGFQVGSISAKGIDASIAVAIKNPNSFGFVILPSEFDVRYTGIYLGKAKLQKRVKIKRNSEETYNFKLKSDFSETNLLDVFKLLNPSSFKNEIELKGDLRAGKLFFRKRFPVNLKENLKLKLN
jgi:LEA14-like dessication related protein